MSVKATPIKSTSTAVRRDQLFCYNYITLKIILFSKPFFFTLQTFCSCLMSVNNSATDLSLTPVADLFDVALKRRVAAAHSARSQRRPLDRDRLQLGEKSLERNGLHGDRVVVGGDRRPRRRRDAVLRQRTINVSFIYNRVFT